jgi:predicted Fe-S protein YdhL (DUF1289 family)
MDPNEHANDTNPCIGICVSEDTGICIGCYRTQDERSNWYLESTDWRVQTLAILADREEEMFGKDN